MSHNLVSGERRVSWLGCIIAAVILVYAGGTSVPLAVAAPRVQADPASDLATKCEDRFERFADPRCLEYLRDQRPPELHAEDNETIRTLSTADGCLAYLAGFAVLEPGEAFAACAARMAALEQRAIEQLKGELSDPTQFTTNDTNASNLEGCMSVGLSMGLSETDANLACALRLARIAEAEANRAFTIIRQAQPADNQARCDELQHQLNAEFSKPLNQWDEAAMRRISEEAVALGCKPLG